MTLSRLDSVSSPVECWHARTCHYPLRKKVQHDTKGSLILGSGLLSRCCKAVWRPIVTCLSQLRRMLLTVFCWRAVQQVHACRDAC